MSYAYRYRLLWGLLPGDVMLTWSDSLVSRAIAWATRQDAGADMPPYSHAEICLECPGDVPPITLSAEPRGLLLRESTRYASKRTRIHVWRCDSITQRQRDAIARLGRTMASADDGYDWAGILHHAGRLVGLDIPSARERAYCSEATGGLLVRSGLLGDPGDPDISPRGLGRLLTADSRWSVHTSII